MKDEIPKAKEGTPIHFRGKDFIVSNEEIKEGDFIWNEASGEVDFCMYTFKDGTLGITMLSHNEPLNRAVLHKDYFQKLIQPPTK